MNDPVKFDLVADLYDSYVTVKLDLEFFMEETYNYDDEILELMCGTGRVSIPLLESGRKPCCVDYSGKMLNVFRNKIASKDYPVRLIQMDIAKLEANPEKLWSLNEMERTEGEPDIVGLDNLTGLFSGKSQRPQKCLL
jgi:hypothetical protein